MDDLRLEQFEKIKSLLATSYKLRTLIPKYNQAISDIRCDKHALKFGGDKRFSVFNVNIYLDCHVGYYGSSACTIFTQVDNEHARKYLIAALNKNMGLVLNSMAELAEKDALLMQSEFEEEIGRVQKMLTSLSTDHSKSEEDSRAP